MVQKLLSVVVPIYNTEVYLKKCIESILNQTYKNIEIILVNDGSTDHSLDICLSYESRYSNIVVVNKENEGVITARRAGLKAAGGGWVAFVDSDDWIEPDMYEQLMDQMEAANAQMAVLGSYTIKEVKHRGTTEMDAKAALGLLCSMQFATSMCMAIYPAELAKRIHVSSDIHFFEDFLFNYMLLHMIDKVALVYGDFYHYTDNPESINHQRINNKRMSCLNIIPMIVQGGELYDEDLRDEVPFAVSHFLISNIIFLRKDDRNCIQYFPTLKRLCRDYGKMIRRSKHVPFLYKAVIWICGRSPALISYVMLMKKE